MPKAKAQRSDRRMIARARCLRSIVRHEDSVFFAECLGYLRGDPSVRLRTIDRLAVKHI